jgi:uncharacterized membrane protein
MCTLMLEQVVTVAIAALNSVLRNILVLEQTLVLPVSNLEPAEGEPHKV